MSSGPCIHCGELEPNHKMACPRTRGPFHGKVMKAEVPDGVLNPPPLMVVADGQPARVAMTEKEAAELKESQWGNDKNIRMACYGKACERMWGEIQENKDAKKPQMDQLVREADMLYDWIMNGKVPEHRNNVVSLGVTH